jgi:DNA polymerase-3 subunit beta
MEFKAPLQDIKAALDVARFTGSVGAPVLTTLHIALTNGVAEFTGFDGETGARTSVKVSSGKSGAGLLPRSAVEYINALPSGDVELVFTTSNVKITCGSLSATMRSDDPANYPKVPFADNDGVDLSAAELRSGIKQVRAAAAPAGSTRVSLSGVLFESVNGEFRLVSTDSYRLAVVSMPNSPLQDGLRVTVPIRAIGELERMLTRADKVTVRMTPQNVCFELGNVKLTTRLIAEQFPNYAAIIPAPSAPVTVKASSSEILESIKRLKIVASKENRSVKVSSTNGKLTITAASAFGDSASEPVNATISGKMPDFAVNVDYLADAVSALSSDEICLSIHDPLKPLLMTRPGDDSSKQIMMPVRV